MTTNTDEPTFDQAYTPPRYPPVAPGATVTWQTFTSNGAEIGLVFTDRQGSAGVWWIKQPPVVTDLDRFFQNMNQSSVAASAAYDAAVDGWEGLEFGEVTSGTDEQLEAVKQAMMASSVESITSPEEG